jgi:hypothetical protein
MSEAIRPDDVRDRRFVEFVKHGRTAMSGEYDDSAVTIAYISAGKIDRIQNTDLRLALQLADVVQATGILPKPSRGGFDVAVHAVVGPKHTCLGEADENIGDVYDGMPDNLFELLERWHEEQ